MDEPLYCYFTNLESTTRSFNNHGVYERCKSAVMALDEIKRRGFYEKYKEEIDYRFFELYYLGSIYAFISKFRPVEINQLKIIRKYMREHFPDYKKQIL